MATNGGFLEGIRVVECALLGPDALAGHLVDFGAEVIKIESPAGDYVRQMTWPIIEGDSLLHLHMNRGKDSLVLDLKVPEAVAVFEELVRNADVVIEAHAPRLPRQARPRVRAAQGAQPRDRVLHASRATARPVPTATCRRTASRTTRGPACSRPSSTTTASRTSRTRRTSASPPVPRSARSAILAALVARRDDRRGREHGDRAVRRGRVLRLVPHRDVEGVRAARSRRSPATRATTTSGGRPVSAGMWRGRALPDLRVVRRARAVHGVGAGVLEELLRGHRPHGPVREVAGQEDRRPRARQPRAAGDPARHLQDEDARRSGSTSPTSTTRRSRR